MKQLNVHSAQQVKVFSTQMDPRYRFRLTSLVGTWVLSWGIASLRLHVSMAPKSVSMSQGIGVAPGSPGFGHGRLRVFPTSVTRSLPSHSKSQHGHVALMDLYNRGFLSHGALYRWMVYMENHNLKELDALFQGKSIQKELDDN